MAVKEKAKDTHDEWRDINQATTVGALPATVEANIFPAASDDYDFGEFEGSGFENVDAAHMAMPFIKVLQSNSPEVKRGPMHVDGAEEGMLYNTATGALYNGEKGVPYIPVDVDHKYVEFFPREDDGTGGGFVGVREPDDELVVRLRGEQSQFGKLRNEDGVEGEPTELNETFSLIGWIVPGWDVSNATRSVTPFASTKIRGYKKFISGSNDIKYWNAKLERYVKPPMFAHRYIMRTVFQQKGNNSWYTIDLKMAEPTKEASFIPKNDPLRALGEELARSCKTGSTRVVYERMEQESSGGSGGDMPF